MSQTRVRRAAIATGLAALLTTTALTGPAFAQTAPVPPPAAPASAPDPTPAVEQGQTTPESAPQGQAGTRSTDQGTDTVTGEQPSVQEADVTAAPGAPGATPAAPAGAPAGAATPPAAAPVPVVQAPAPVVQRILVEGNERIETATILSYLPIQPGEPATPERIDEGLKILFRTELFADVQVRVVGSDLIVRVVENPIINQVIFEGNRALAEDKLRDEVTVRPRGIFTRSRVQADVQRIVELYRRSGRIGATVSPQIVELPQKRVDLIFAIAEGSETGVRGITFLGNEAFSDRDLRDIVVTEESRWYRFFSSNDNYDPDRLEYDREQLRKHYRNRGYYDFRIASAVAELTPDQRGFAVTYTIDEGQEYEFGELKVETELARLDPRILQALLPIQSGQTYSDERVERAVDAITFAAGSAGFAFVDIRPRSVANPETRKVDITFEVREGPRVYVERIDVVGNTRTLDQVIRREMRLAEGDAFNRVLLDRSRNNLRALGFFKDVEIEEVQGSTPDRTVVRVTVTEQPTGEFSFGAGFSSVDAFLIDLGVTERNFRGRGQSVRARLSLGSLRQNLDFQFTEPRFLGRNLAAGVDLFSYRYDYSQYAAFDTSSTGAGLRLGFGLSEYASFTGRYNLRVDDIQVDEGACAAGTVSRTLCEQRGANITSLVGYTVRWDRRNDPIRPTRGFRLTGLQEVAGVGGDVNYVRSEADGSIYYGIRPNWIFTLDASAGYVDGWGGDTVRINDRFFKGGNSFRGFETAGIGPRDVAFDDALGGKLYAIGSLELSFPTGLPEQYGVGAALFLEAGTLGLLDDEQVTASVRDDLGLRASTGISIFWDSPMGPIRFDFSQVLAKEEYDKTETFRFTTNTRF